MDLLICGICHKNIPLASKFCGQCGGIVPPEDIDAAQRTAEAQLAEGQRLYVSGKLDEALMVAQGLSQADPTYVPAMALQGDVLERLGQYQEALAVYEAVVDLEPTSALDRIRVAHLKRLVDSQDEPHQSVQNKKLPYLAIAAAAVLLVSASSAVVLANRRPATPKTALAQDEPANATRAFSTPIPVPTTNGKKAAAGQDEENAQATREEAQEPATGNTKVTTRANARIDTSNALPDGGPANGNNDGYRPVDPFTVAPENLPNASKTEANSDPEPTVVGNNKEEAKEAEPQNREVVDIRPSGQSPKNVGGSETTTDGNEAETLVRVARQHYLAHNYSQAASAYERALRAGASPASTNHRLAQCYEKLGRRGDAVSAYRRALNSYESQIRSSGGNRLLESQADSCRKAIAVLGG